MENLVTVLAIAPAVYTISQAKKTPTAEDIAIITAVTIIRPNDRVASRIGVKIE